MNLTKTLLASALTATVIIAGVVYYKKKTKTKGRRKTKVAKKRTRKAKVISLELKQKGIKDYLKSANELEVRNFHEANNFIKEAVTSVSPYQAKDKDILFYTSTLAYMLTLKTDKNHKERVLLGETARLFREELMKVEPYISDIITKAKYRMYVETITDIGIKGEPVEVLRTTDEILDQRARMS